MEPPDSRRRLKSPRPQPAAPKAGKARPRLGLYAPFAALAVAILAWSLGWFWLRDEVYRRMDAAARSWEDAGYRIDWATRSVSGYPFRLDVDLTGARLRETSGWALAAARLKAEAFVFAPDHWVVVAPAGVVLARRVGGPLVVGARVLRASLSEGAAHPPRLSVEGLDLIFTAPSWAEPFGLASARELHLHARAGPRDQGAAYAELDGARTSGPGPLADIAGGAPLTLVADGVFSHAGALGGRGFAGALRAWTAAGGSIDIRRLSVDAGKTELDSRAGSLAIGADGRLAGVIDLTILGGPRLISTLGEHNSVPAEAATVVLSSSGIGPAAVTLNFQAGQTTLGPVALGPSPRID